MHLPSARGHPFRRKLTLSAVVSRRRDPFETINRKQQRDAQGCRQRASLSEDFKKWFPLPLVLPTAAKCYYRQCACVRSLPRKFQKFLSYASPNAQSAPNFGSGHDYCPIPVSACDKSTAYIPV